MTRAELDALLRTTVDNALGRVQGLYESSRSAFEKTIQADLKALKPIIEVIRASGVEITPQIEKQMRQEVITRAYENAPQEIQPGQPVPQAPEEYPDEEPDPVTMAAWEMMEQSGVTIEDNDPEISMIVDEGTPLQFIRSIEKAIAAKQARLGQTPGQPPAPQAPHAPTNLGGSGGPTNEYHGQVMHPDEIWKRLSNK
jgi:hypothetical protein